MSEAKKPSWQSVKVAGHIMAVAQERCAEYVARRESIPACVIHMGRTSLGLTVDIVDAKTMAPIVFGLAMDKTQEHDLLDKVFDVLETRNAVLHIVYNGQCKLFGEYVGK